MDAEALATLARARHARLAAQADASAAAATAPAVDQPAAEPEPKPDPLALIAALAATLRAFFYPKQRAFFTSPARRKATKKTRRSGATAGGCRELIARAIARPGFRATYVASTRIEAEARAWMNDTGSGFVDVIIRYGTLVDRPGSIEVYDLAGVTVEVRPGDLELIFSNGSKIDLWGADEERAFRKLRGLAKHVFWIDEAQDFRFLARFYKAVIVGAMTDFRGECWLTGTPGRDCLGMFYDVTRDDGRPAPGWEVHRITVEDNPFFGRVVWERGEWFVEDNLFDDPDLDHTTHAWGGEIAADAHRWGPFDSEDDATDAARKVRWERAAGADIRENAWEDDDPDLLREWRARWVKEGSRFVYALHAVENSIAYAPVRLAADGFPDIRAAIADLPGRKELRQYWTVLGADLGTRAAFAFVIWAWSLKDPILYELCSWKRSGLDYDEMAAHLHAVRGQVNLSMITADAGGGGKPAVMGWSKKWVDRYQIAIIEATKQNKRVAQNHLNSDIRKGLIKLRAESVLMVEWRSHVWKPLRTEDGKEVEESTPHDASDGALYAHRESYHHRYRPDPESPVPGSPEAVTREERELEAYNCEQDDRNDPYALYGSHR